MTINGIFHWMIIIGVILVIRYVYKNKTYKVDENVFSQAGVTVKFSDGTIDIKGKTYPVNKVKGVRWENTRRGANQGYSELYIEVDDISEPVHNIRLNFAPLEAEKLSSRLRIAIEKAGGPIFT